MTQLHSQ